MCVLVLVVVCVLALGRRIPPVMVGIALLATASLFPAVSQPLLPGIRVTGRGAGGPDPDGPPGSGIFDRSTALGDRRRAVGICVSLAAALSIAHIALPFRPIEVPIAGQMGATGVIAHHPDRSHHGDPGATSLADRMRGDHHLLHPPTSPLMC